MIVTVETTPPTQRLIAKHKALADQADRVTADGIEAAVAAGAEVIAEAVKVGKVGIRSDSLAASVSGWMIDRTAPLGAIGVPSDSPAAAYARIQHEGGTIYPRTAKALAIPVSDEARQYSSPRDMGDLTYIKRKAGPPLLVRQLTRRGNVRGFELHWVLVGSVTLPRTQWLTRGAELARPAIREAYADVIDDYVKEFGDG